MRTTLNLNDALMRKVKRAAHLSGRTLTEVIEAALGEYLAPKAPAPAGSPLPKSACRGGLQPGVTLNSTSEVLHDLETGDAPF